jgi:hypothetical protein
MSDALQQRAHLSESGEAHSCGLNLQPGSTKRTRRESCSSRNPSCRQGTKENMKNTNSSLRRCERRVQPMMGLEVLESIVVSRVSAPCPSKRRLVIDFNEEYGQNC